MKRPQWIRSWCLVWESSKLRAETSGVRRVQKDGKQFNSRQTRCLILRDFTELTPSEAVRRQQHRPGWLYCLLSLSICSLESKYSLTHNTDARNKCPLTHNQTHGDTQSHMCTAGALQERVESSITLPPLTISQGVLKSNVFSNAGLWLVAGPGWMWYMSWGTRERAAAFIQSRNGAQASFPL